MEDLFGTIESEAQGFQAGTNKNLNDIRYYVQPILNQQGFDIELFTANTAKEGERRELELHKSKDWSQFSKRFIEGGSGNLHRLFAQGHPEKALPTQIIIIDSIRAVVGKARFNIPRNIVDSTTNENRVKETLEALNWGNVYLFLYVKTGWYILLRYADVPEDQWKLTYRGKDHSRLNRMYVQSEYLNKRFKRISKLSDEITSIL